MSNILENKTILLVISGGIAAYKSLELIRLIRKSGGRVRAILTKGGEQFVTPLTVSALCEEPVYTDLWSLKDESEMGHIRLSREADIIIIAPASADIMAKMAHGLANDLASTALLAADKQIMIAPAMNHMMWENAATQANIKTLQERGVQMVGPDEGDMACGEFGMGRMSEPADIYTAIEQFFFSPAANQGINDNAQLHTKPLAGKTALVTSGPTYEAIDPVRFLGNRSSGKQGHAIAAALAAQGADVKLISGPVSIPDPAGVTTIHIESATDMLTACENALPTDIAVCAAAVADWHIEQAGQKIKKRHDGMPPSLELCENPDILQTISNHANRPTLVVGFAAETQNLIENAQSKLNRKSCDMILANDVSSQGKSGKSVFGADENHVYLVTSNNTDDWGAQSKRDVAQKLAQTIASMLDKDDIKHAAE